MRMLSPNSSDLFWSRCSLSPARMGDVFEDFDRLIDGLMRPTFTAAAKFQPSCNINETNDHYLATFDIPGVKKEDIKIEIQGDRLLVSGERQREVKEEEGGTSIYNERAYGRFERSLTLPTTIATDRVEAHYENGVLNIVLPKAETAKGRTIQIQMGQTGFLSKLLGPKKDVDRELRDAKVS